MTHSLKLWPGQFEAATDGRKKHEVRRNDRRFAVGDFVILEEFVPNVNQTTGEPLLNEDGNTLGTLTGKSLLRRICYVTPPGSWGLPDDVIVFSISA